MIHRGDQKPDLSNYNIRIQLPKNMEELSNKVHLISFYVTEGSNLDVFSLSVTTGKLSLWK